MAAPDLLRQPEIAAIRDLELAARALVAELRHGRHAAPLLGAGAEVKGLRPYRQGDEAASVDWKRSARGDRLYTRERVDTSRTQVLLVVDASRSMAAGQDPGQPGKLDAARTVAAALALLAAEQGDAVGLFVSDDRAGRGLAPAGGLHHAQVVIGALAALEAGGAMPPSRLVRLAAASLRRPALIVVLTDGWDEAAYPEALRRAAAAGHDVLALHLAAPGDRQLPPAGVVELEDAETGDVVAVDVAELGAAFAAAAAAFHASLDHALRGPRLACARLAIDAPLAPQLRAVLTARADG